MVLKKNKKNIQEKKNLVSKTKKIELSDKVARDILKIINKYSVSQNLTVSGELSDKEKGFYLIFINRDESKSVEERLLTYTFGCYMPVEDLIEGLQETVFRILDSKAIHYDA